MLKKVEAKCKRCEKEFCRKRTDNCGWRIVVCQLRGDKVILHHHGKVATMKCKAFKELLAAHRVVRPPYVREVCSEHAALVEK